MGGHDLLYFLFELHDVMLERDRFKKWTAWCLMLPMCSFGQYGLYNI